MQNSVDSENAESDFAKSGRFNTVLHQNSAIKTTFDIA